jgi:3-hydroxyacyl-[acyl-carrier-protein] dehydratase
MRGKRQVFREQPPRETQASDVSLMKPDLLEIAIKALPHGPEFRFLDRLLSLVPGEKGVGEYLVRGDEYYLRGHLPGEPILPGVLLVEAGAQLAGVVAQEDPYHPTPLQLKLTAIRAVKILGTARPGETLQLEATITGRLGRLLQARVTASVSGSHVMTAELTLTDTGAQSSSSAPSSAP